LTVQRRGGARRFVRPVAGVLVALGCVAACAERPTQPARSAASLDAPDPEWHDAFDPPPPLLLAFRPRALQSDPLYGPLLRRALALARIRSRVVAATRAIDAIEDADEVVCGLRPPRRESGPSGPASSLDDGDWIAAIRGVRADIDPATVVDGNGHTLWQPGPLGRVRELVRAPDDSGVEASLFELPGRVWVIASGAEAARVRESFARPRPHRPLDLDDRALALLRIDGPSLVDRVPALRGDGALSPVGMHLRGVVMEIDPAPAGDGGAPDDPDAARSDKGAIEGHVEYSDESAAAAAEQVIGDVIAAVRRTHPPGLEWLGSVRVEDPRPRLSEPSGPNEPNRPNRPNRPNSSGERLSGHRDRHGTFPTVDLATPLPAQLVVAFQTVGFQSAGRDRSAGGDAAAPEEAGGGK
jgi:hypothetical protein